MELHELTEAFVDEISGSLNEHVFSRTKGNGEEVAFLSLDEVEQDNDSTVILYTTYWVKYLHLKVKKGNATAGWSKQNPTNGINVSFEIGFKEESFNRFLITVDVLYGGVIGKAAYRIEDDVVSDIGEFETRADGNGVCSERYMEGSYMKNAMEVMSNQIRHDVEAAYWRVFDE